MVLSGLTDQNSGSPAIQNLHALHMFDKMPICVLIDSGVDRGWNYCILASTDQEFSTGECCRVGLLN